MKRVVQFCFSALAIMLLMAGCNKGGPKDVAGKWLTAFYQQDYETAKKYSTEDTRKFIGEFDELYKILPDSSRKDLKKETISIKDVKQNGDKAVVTYATSAEPGKEQQLSLVKQNDKWLVQFSKDDVPSDLEENTADQADTTGAAPVPEAAPSDTGKH